jgi:hypothetical protein
MKTILILSAFFAADARPPQAPPIDERLTGVESRVSTLEARVDLVERDVEKLTGKEVANPGNDKCPCGPDCNCKGGNCDCDPGKCKCPNCPERIEGNETARVLFFTADWCTHCGPAKDRLGDLMDQIEIVDCTDGNPHPEYNVTAYPTCLLLDDNGKVKTRCEGEHIGKLIVGGWLGKSSAEKPAKLHSNQKPVQDSRIETNSRTVHHDDGDASDDQIRQHLVDAHGYSWSQVSGMSRSQLKAAHDQSHGGPAVVAKNYPVRRYSQPTIRYTQPAQYRPTTYYRPSYNSYCPNCR